MDLIGRKLKAFQVRTRQGTRPIIVTAETRGITDSQQTINLNSCPWGEVLHDMSEVKAMCWICESPICEKHMNTMCEICQRVTCIDCISQNKSKFVKAIVCNAHSTWQVMVFVSRNGKSK